MTLSTAPTWAQTPPKPSTPAETNSTSGRRARRLFAEGADAYARGKYEEAIDLFLEANKLEPNPALAYNVGVAYEDTGDAASALRWYREYLREDPNANDRSAVELRVKRLERVLRERGLQQVTVLTTPPGALVSIDDRPVGLSPWTGEVPPGLHRLVLRAEGRSDASTRFELLPHRAMDIRVELSPDPTRSKPMNAPRVPDEPVASADPGKSGWVGMAGWAALGVGAASLIGATAFEVARASAEDDFRHASTATDSERYWDSMKKRETKAHILLGMSVVAVLTGGVLLHLDDAGDNARTNGPQRKSVAFGCDSVSCHAIAMGAF